MWHCILEVYIILLTNVTLVNYWGKKARGKFVGNKKKNMFPMLFSSKIVIWRPEERHYVSECVCELTYHSVGSIKMIRNLFRMK